VIPLKQLFQKIIKIKTKEFGKALTDIAQMHLKNKSEIRRAMFKKKHLQLTGKKEN
jgi:hypothetical protein